MIIEADNVKFPHKEDLYESQYKGLQQLSDWWNSNELEATLKGYAGTGKTYLLKYFILCWIPLRLMKKKFLFQ